MTSYITGEVSDDDGGLDDSDSDAEFHDGLDENLIGDDEDRKRLEQMTEREREQEIFKRIERREMLKTRLASTPVQVVLVSNSVELCASVIMYRTKGLIQGYDAGIVFSAELLKCCVILVSANIQIQC